MKLSGKNVGIHFNTVYIRPQRCGLASSTVVYNNTLFSTMFSKSLFLQKFILKSKSKYKVQWEWLIFVCLIQRRTKGGDTAKGNVCSCQTKKSNGFDLHSQQLHNTSCQFWGCVCVCVCAFICSICVHKIRQKCEGSVICSNKLSKLLSYLMRHHHSHHAHTHTHTHTLTTPKLSFNTELSHHLELCPKTHSLRWTNLRLLYPPLVVQQI